MKIQFVSICLKNISYISYVFYIFRTSYIIMLLWILFHFFSRLT